MWPPRSLALVVLPAVLSVVAVASDASAVCGRAADVSFVPYGDRIAPLNARVRLTLPRAWREHSIDCTGRTGSEVSLNGACRPGRYALTLQVAPTKPAPVASVQATLRESISGDFALVEMIPSAPLRPRTRYEVWHGDGAASVRPRIVATFETGDAVDDVAPTWQGIKRARRMTNVVECESDGIDLVVWAARDDATPVAQIRYGVWVEDDHGHIDYEAPARVYVAGTPEAGARHPAADELEIHLGTMDRDFVLPEKKANKKTLKIGLRAVDLAGNASAPRETTVTL